MKFKFKECVRDLTLNDAISFITINGVVHYKGLLIELSFFDEIGDSKVLISYDDKLSIVLPSCYLIVIMKSLHYFVHHKWLFKNECVGLVHCLLERN